MTFTPTAVALPAELVPCLVIVDGELHFARRVGGEWDFRDFNAWAFQGRTVTHWTVQPELPR